MNAHVQRAYAGAADKIAAAFRNAGAYPDQEVTPPLLIEALEQCIEILGSVDRVRELASGELEELGTHALNCVSDLALWAAHLGLEAERAAVEDLGLEFAQGLAAKDVPITVIEPVVNALARRANAVQDPGKLAPLAQLARDLVGAVADGARAEAAGNNAWQTLNFNYAIIATRTQQPEIMAAAYDVLEANLPQHCPAFFEEGVRESKKAAYGAHVGELMRARLAKWTVRH